MNSYTTKIEGKLVKVLPYQAKVKDGVVQNTANKSILIVESKNNTDGYEKTEYTEIKSTAPVEDFALGQFKAEIKISAWQNYLIIKLVRVLK